MTTSERLAQLAGQPPSTAPSTQAAASTAGPPPARRRPALHVQHVCTSGSSRSSRSSARPSTRRSAGSSSGCSARRSSTASRSTAMLLAFGTRSTRSARCSRCPPRQRFLQNTLWNLLTAGRLTVDVGFALDPLSMMMVLDHHRHRHAHPRLLHRLHGRRAGVLAVLLVPEPLRLRDAPPRHGGQLRDHVLRVGGRRPRVLPASSPSGTRDREKAAAGMKAFVVNRFGDFGFLAGLLLLFWGLGGSWAPRADGRPHDRLRARAPACRRSRARRTRRESEALAPRVARREGRPDDELPRAAGPGRHRDDRRRRAASSTRRSGASRSSRSSAMLLFVGAMGKSAQLPLYVWLPDAMAGPTPVSALIHAATMVTAGVYMVARLNFLFALSPSAMALGRAHRRAHRAVRRVDRLLPVRHQEGPRLLDGLAARLHVHRRRRRRVLGRRLPPAHARLLQGLPLPRVGLGHPRLPPRAGHAEHGRAQEVHAHHALDLPLRVHRDRRLPDRERLLLEGRDPLEGVHEPSTSTLFGTPTPWLGPLIYVVGIIAATGTSFYMFRSYYMTFTGEYRGGEGHGARAQRGSARRRVAAAASVAVHAGGARPRRGPAHGHAPRPRRARRAGARGRRTPATRRTATTPRDARGARRRARATAATTAAAARVALDDHLRPRRSSRLARASRFPRHPDGLDAQGRSSSTGSRRPSRPGTGAVTIGDAHQHVLGVRCSRRSASAVAFVGWLAARALYKDARSDGPGAAQGAVRGRLDGRLQQVLRGRALRGDRVKPSLASAALLARSTARSIDGLVNFVGADRPLRRAGSTAPSTSTSSTGGERRRERRPSAVGRAFRQLQTGRDPDLPLRRARRRARGGPLNFLIAANEGATHVHAKGTSSAGPPSSRSSARR